MIWGLGTGRCGTKSLAVQMNLLHEPVPRYMKTGAIYHNAGEYEDEIRGVIRERMALATKRNRRGVSDLHNVPVIPLILREDPDARFVWLWRGFREALSSQLGGGHWYWDEGYHRDWDEFMHPREGWGDADRFDKGLWYYVAVNTEIYRKLSLLDRERWGIFHISSLTARENIGPSEVVHIPERVAAMAEPIQIAMDYMTRQQQCSLERFCA